MGERPAVSITAALSIPLSELSFRASRSGGPGGQHVNTSSTRVELWWDALGSPSLDPEQRALLLSRMGGRLTDEGLLRLVAGSTRSQAQNKAETIARFQELLARALKPIKRRKPTRPGRAAKERRLSEKRQRGERKRERRRPRPEE
jgi:ribosome-associated protein